MNPLSMKEKPNQNFPKKEKLTQHHLIERMFSSKHPSLLAHPIRMVYFFNKIQPIDPKAMVLLLVSKRNLKKATDRNLVKRHLREAYRINKVHLLDKCSTIPDKNLVVMFIYLSKEVSAFDKINQSIFKLFKSIEFSSQSNS